MRQFILTIAVVLCASCTSLSASEDQRIVAIGDLHGDYAAFEKVVTRAGLMDAGGDWAGGRTIFVQTGDVPDRGPDTRRIIEKLRYLQRQAPRDGGRVVTLVGNHEAMNVIGDLRYTHPGEFTAYRDGQSENASEEAFDTDSDEIIEGYRSEEPELTSEQAKAKWLAQTPIGFVEHRQAWAPDGDVGAWVAGNPAMVVVGETLFAHGGPSAKYAVYTVAEINRMAAEALKAQSRDKAVIINDPLGPLWYRALIRESGETFASGADGELLTIEAELKIILEHFRVKRVVVGHTPSLEGIKSNHDGKVIQIDTGMSSAYGGVSSFLEIAPKGVFADIDGHKTRIGD